MVFTSSLVESTNQIRVWIALFSMYTNMISHNSSQESFEMFSEDPFSIVRITFWGQLFLFFLLASTWLEMVPNRLDSI